MVEVKIYTTETCPWCEKAKAFFKSKKIEYTELNVVEEEEAREAMIEKSGQMGVPVIEIGDNIIVGFDKSAIEKALAE
ncbi:MAG: NrdH-redoxin [Nanoarchaeota archaeon]|nr:NrdH-redoxin [Nanoarchaeota archaeon]|tara:strand:- start:3497 stop:3730 length:234 start_codon:yes stop_codon:yes gene_type:complete